MSPDRRVHPDDGAGEARSPGRGDPGPSGSRPGWLLATLALLLTWGLAEVTAVLVTPVLNARLDIPILTRAELLRRHRGPVATFLESGYRQADLDPHLGWRYRAGFARGGDTLNLQGLRSVREYAPVPDSGTLRIAAFGDSFVYCTEVANPDCWTRLLEKGHGVEVLNYGVGGYGSDQAFLRFLDEGDDLSPDLVLIGFAPVNLRRIVNRYRGFLAPSEGPWFKPRFTLDSLDLSLLPPPVGSEADARRFLTDGGMIREVGEGDHWYEPLVYRNPLYVVSPLFRLTGQTWIRIRRRALGGDRLFVDGVFSTRSEAFALQTRVLRAFADSVETRGRRAAFLMLPGRNDVDRVARGLPTTYAPLREWLEGQDLTVLDPVESFVAGSAGSTGSTGVDGLFAPGGHYSPRGNAVLARAVAAALGLDPMGSADGTGSTPAPLPVIP